MIYLSDEDRLTIKRAILWFAVIGTSIAIAFGSLALYRVDTVDQHALNAEYWANVLATLQKEQVKTNDSDAARITLVEKNSVARMHFDNDTRDLASRATYMVARQQRQIAALQKKLAAMQERAK